MDGSCPWGLYVHLPWCRYRCPYCAFVVDARKDPPHEAYENALLREWELRRPLFVGPPASLYFGGGTPSRSPLSTFEALIQAIQPHSGAEITAEANPEDLNPQLLSDWRRVGITRVSLGVQSFFPEVGAKLGRRRGSRVAREAVERTREAGFRSFSIDLIFGGPGQSEADWEAELGLVEELGVPHVSLYGLTQEEGTAFGRLGERLDRAEDERWRWMYEHAVQRLAALGIHRYEVSNFARFGHESVHNQHYWRPNPWLGLGVGAHSWWPDHRRAQNRADIEGYLQAADPVEAAERADHPLAAWDYLWSMLRHRDGIDRRRYWELTGRTLQVPASLKDFLEQTPERVLLRDAGYPVADAVARRLYDALPSMKRRSAVSVNRVP